MTMSLDPVLLEILACPLCKEEVKLVPAVRHGVAD